MFERADTKGAASDKARDVVHSLSLVEAAQPTEVPADAEIIGDTPAFRERPIQQRRPINLQERPLLTITLGVFFGMMASYVAMWVFGLLMLPVLRYFMQTAP